MDIKAIKEYLGVDWLAVQNQIASSLKSDIGLLNATNDSILSHSGKQLTEGSHAFSFTFGGGLVKKWL